MNRLTTRTAAVTACLAALFAGATACGTEDGTSTGSGARPAASSVELANSAKANQQVYLQRLQAQARAEAARQARVEKADAARAAHGNSGGSAGYGDDHRQQTQRPYGGYPGPHPAGYDKALRGEQ
jgi:hypothetical protein